MTIRKLSQLNFIDLFSGAGGLSCGLEMAGHRCLLGVDMNKDAIKTFELNHKHAKSFCGPIQDLTKKKLTELTNNKQVHVVVGGPPCQGFSTVGVGNPSDKRNSLFLEFVRVVKETSPYFIIMENVTGLLAKKNEKVLETIIRKFRRLGYEIDVQVMEAHKYGVPEKRRRTIFIGSRINSTVSFPNETHDTIVGNSRIPAMTVGDALKKLARRKRLKNHCLDMAQLKTKLDLRRIKRIPEGKGVRYKKDELSYFTPSLRLGVDWEKLPENRFRQTKYQRLDRKKPSPTIMTHRHTYYHPTENRFLTAREAATLQSFPLDFEFVGPISSQWRQIGNAVPPLLGKALGEELTLMMKRNSKKASAQSKRKLLKKNIHNQRSNAFIYKDSATQ